MRPGCELNERRDVAREDSWGMRHVFLWVLQLFVLGEGGTLGSPQKEGSGGHDAWV